MNDQFYISVIQDKEIKSSYTRVVLDRLPEWFGNKQAVRDYGEQVKELPFWAAFNENGQCIGFFAVTVHYGHTGDIVVCGVLPEYQHNGVGRALYRAVEEYFAQNSCEYVVVKTLSDLAVFEPYERTRSFYKSIGFVPLITLTEMWDENNPCLIMLKAMKESCPQAI